MPHSEPSGIVPPRSEPTGVAMVCHQPIVLPVLPVPFSLSLASTPGYQAKPYLPANSAGLRSFQEIVYQSGSISFSLTIVRTSIRNCSLSPLTIGCVTALSSIPKVCSAAHICSRFVDLAHARLVAGGSERVGVVLAVAVGVVVGELARHLQ